MAARKPETPLCPCDSGRRHADCCGPALSGTPAPSAEALMRSRYTAYTLRDEAYLLATWHSSTRPARLDLANDDARWMGLTVKRHEATGEHTALVEFVARYKIGGRAHRMHETSRFVREDGRWYYVDGNIHAA